MSSVAGTHLPAVLMSRTDEAGRPISLDQRQPQRNTLMFTGAPGMGKSIELARAEDLAKQHGWICIRVEAPKTETLEMRLARAIKQQLPDLRKQFGLIDLYPVKKTVKDLTPRRGQQKGFEGRLNLGITTWVWKTQWDARGTVTASLSQFADNLADLSARKKDTYVLLIVDDLPLPPPGNRALTEQETYAAHNLDALAQLTNHLDNSGRHVYLITAGAKPAAAALMERVEGGMGIGSAARSKFDLRDCRPMTPDQLRAGMMETLVQAGVPYYPDAVEQLVRTANGDPARMRDLMSGVVAMAPAELTPEVAKLATAAVNADRASSYENAWSTCSNAEMDLLMRTAAQGPQGLAVPVANLAGGSEKWQALERARTNLNARGMVRETDGRLTIADPGLQEWVNTRVGQSVVNAGVPLPGTPALNQSASPALNQSGIPALDQSAPGTGKHRRIPQSTPHREGNPTITR